MVLSAHVDDLKVTGQESMMSWLFKSMEQEVGKLTVHENAFTHCGIEHEQIDLETVVLHQEPYAKSLKPMSVPSGPEEQTLDARAHSHYRTLLGGVSWLTLTRYDIAVYVCALQRYSQSPMIKHAVALNRLLKYIQKTPFRCYYRKMGGTQRVTIVSDSAFRKEEKDGLAMRGCLVCLTEHHSESPGGRLHVLEHYSRKQKRVCRSTFSAEINALVDSLESGKTIMFLVTEMRLGCATPTELQQREELGRWPIPLECCIDAKSVFAATSVAESKSPLEESLVTLVLIIREALQCERISKLWWIDTRDMLADALTKGSCPRLALLNIAKTGEWKVLHPSEWTSFKKQNDQVNLTLLTKDVPAKISDGLWELPRSKTGLELLGDQSTYLVYVLSDEKRRSFAGLVRSALSRYDADYFYGLALNTVQWQRPTSTTGVPMRRQTAWMVTAGCSCQYQYGDFQVQATHYPGWMIALWQHVSYGAGVRTQLPNSCNVNLYDSIADGISWHSDNELLFNAAAQDSSIYSLSLGSTAEFELRCRTDADSSVVMSLTSGDVCTMEGMCQKHYLHRIVPSSMQGGRINFTWRNIVKHATTCLLK